jgi:hypothetical protein
MKSPLHTGILAALLAVVPLLYVLSAALVALTTLRHGLSAGTRVLIAALIGGVISWQLSGVPLSLLVLTLATLLAVVLRATQSWNRTLLVGSVLGVVFAFIAQALFQDQFNSIMASVQEILTGGNAETAEWQMIEALKPLVGFIILSSQVMEALLSLLLARYWQAGLFNPGGLKVEMHGLRFTWQEAAFLVVAIFVSIVAQPGAVMLFGIPFVVVGMALIHGIVAKLKLGGQWVVAMYIALILFNQIILPLLVLLVLADSIFDIRSRIPERSTSDNE